VAGGIPIRWLLATVAPPFRVIARLRRQRAFHPRGVVFDAVVADAAPSLTTLRGRRAVVRLSRAAGLPDALPDVAGLAVRVLDAGGSGLDQDLLLSTVGTRRPLHHLLRFTRRPGAATYSTVLPTRVDGLARLLTARLEGQGVAAAAGLDGLAAAVEQGAVVVHLDAVPLVRGPSRRLMTLHLGRRLEPPRTARSSGSARPMPGRD
jgi:hypothetical protein